MSKTSCEEDASFQPVGAVAARVVEGLAERLQVQSADAERLAASYDYDVDALWFQYDRRCFGSFTTTLAGSPDQRDRFFRAWEVARDRHKPD